MIPLQCKDFDGAPPCCTTCHNDADEYWPDYALGQTCECDLGGESYSVVAELCCAVELWLKRQPDWQDLVRSKAAAEGQW